MSNYNLIEISLTLRKKLISPKERMIINLETFALDYTKTKSFVVVVLNSMVDITMLVFVHNHIATFFVEFSLKEHYNLLVLSWF